MFYHDFEICIEKLNGDHYPLHAELRVNDVVRAKARGELSLNDCLPEFERGLAKLEEWDADRGFAKTFGQALYRCLFRDEIDDLYQQSLGRVAGDKEAGLRLKLEVAPPELSAVPWELLHDKKLFLATSTKTPLVRTFGMMTYIEELKTTLPIRVLIVIPEGMGLGAEDELRGVVEALEGLGEAVEYRVLDRKVTPQACRDALHEGKPYHVFHFIGHGSYDEDSQGCLDFNGEVERVLPLKAESFALFFENYPSTKLVILNSCEGARVSKTRPLAGVAPQVVGAGVPAVIAMQYPIRDKVARLFASEFYKSLCRRDSPEQGRVDAAIAYARRSVCQDFGETNDFAIPVLFMRSPNGVIFDLQEGKPITSPAEAHTAAEVVVAREHNEAVLLARKEHAAPEEAARLEQKRKEEAEAARRVREKIRLWRRRVVVTSVLTAFVVCAALWVSLFNIIGLDDYLERQFTARLMDPGMSKPFAEEVRLISVGEGENGVFGKFDRDDSSNNIPRWRKNYAKLIGDLSAAGAKVVALDIYFISSQNPTDAEKEANAKLAEAIGKAESAREPEGPGTKVIFGVRADPKHEGPQAAEKMPEEIRKALNGSWADVDNLWVRRSGVTHEALLGRKIADGPAEGCEAGEAGVLPSFPLLAAMRAGGPKNPPASCPEEEHGRAGHWKQPVRACLDENTDQLNLRDAAGQLVKQIPFQHAWDRHEIAPVLMPMHIKLDLARVPQLESVTQPLQAIYNPPAAGDQSSPDNWRLKNPGDYAGKIVLVGVEGQGACGKKGSDVFCVTDAEGGERQGKRYGVELQANILSNLLTCLYIHPLTVGWSLLITFFMVALGALFQTRLRRWRGPLMPFRLPFFDRSVRIPLLLIAVVLVYFLVAVVAYREWRVLFGEFHYHLLGLVIAYLLVGRTRRLSRVS